MLSKQYVITSIEAGRSGALDGRDLNRLAEFFTPAEITECGWTLMDGLKTESEIQPVEWTEENLKAQLSRDIAFGFEKALNPRGISASLMHDVIKMWMWVFEDPLQYYTSYAQYGLPLLKAVAIKYEFPNEIGDDNGDEYKYAGVKLSTKK